MTQPDRDRVMQKFMRSVGRGVELGEDDGEEVRAHCIASKPCWASMEEKMGRKLG